MPALCSKLAYYAGIMLDALACLLCLKLCRHNQRMPIGHYRLGILPLTGINDVPSAWLYGQDHLWATQDLVSSPGELEPPPSPPFPSSHPPTPL